MGNESTRRSAIKTLVAGSAAMAGMPLLQKVAAAPAPKDPIALKGNINHSVCRWTFNQLSLEQLCQEVKGMGFSAIDLVGPADWFMLKKYGIDSSMCNGAEINLTDGFADKKFHPTLVKNYTDVIEQVAKAGYKNLICFSGNRAGMDDETGLKNCVEGLQQIMPLAEKAGVMIQMELLNSKVNHKDYLADKSAFGVELCKRLGSPNFKLLYDIYHMQIDEGDVIATIKANHEYFGHYHTAGVPGRHEIDDTQELYYPAIMRAIADTGFKGHVAQEFIPTGKTDADKLAALKKAVEICDV